MNDRHILLAGQGFAHPSPASGSGFFGGLHDSNANVEQIQESNDLPTLCRFEFGVDCETFRWPLIG
jgi:hypothetical protein